jgi:hypothetical protein
MDYTSLHTVPWYYAVATNSACQLMFLVFTFSQAAVLVSCSNHVDNSQSNISTEAVSSMDHNDERIYTAGFFAAITIAIICCLCWTKRRLAGNRNL